MTRARLALLLGVLAVTLPGVPADAHHVLPCPRPGAYTEIGAWLSAKAPRFVERAGGAGQDVTTYVTDPLTPERSYVTNGTSVSVTRDSGCTWTEVFSLPETPDDVIPFTAATSRITEIRVATDPKQRSAVWLVAQEATDAGARPHVLYARAGKRGQFVTRDTGLPPVGRAHDLVISPANADFAYLAVDAGAVADPGVGLGSTQAPIGGLYASTDGTASWTGRTPLGSQATYDVLAVDPGSSNNLWAVERGHLRHSTDGGRTFDAPRPTDAEQDARSWVFSALSVVRPPRSAPVVHAWSAGTPTVRPAVVVLTADGRTARAGPAPGPVESASSSYDGTTAVVSTRAVDGRPARILHGEPGKGDWFDITPGRATHDYQVSVDGTGAPHVHAMGKRALLTYDAEIVPPAPGLPPPGATVLDPGAPRPVGPASLLPARTTLRLRGDESRDVRFVATLPHRNVPLDLYFLLDASESMAEELPALRAQSLALVAELRRAGVDVWAGVGFYRTTCEAPAYRRELAVGPTDDPARLRDALAAVTAQAPGLETQLFALGQAVTGAGAAVVPPPDPACGVPTGLPTGRVPSEQQAGFRDAALKVVVHATDITFRKAYTCVRPCLDPGLTPTRPDGSVDLAPAAAEFVQGGVLALGVAAADADGRPDLTAFGRLAKSFAPAQGLDCDGDGRAEVAAGEPLVCRDLRHVAPVLRDLLSAVSLPRPVVVASRPSPVLVGVSPGSLPDADVTRDLAQPLTARFSCAGVEPGSYQASLAVRVGADPVGTALAQVTCLPAVSLAVPPAANPPAAVAAPGSAPAPAPAAPAPAVQPQAQVQTQVQPNPQVQAGMQDEEAVEVALAAAGWAELQDGREAEEVASRFVVGLSAAALGVGGAVARRQQRRQEQRQRA